MSENTATKLFPCPSCSGVMEFEPGSTKLVCRQCGNEVQAPGALPLATLERAEGNSTELDYLTFLSETALAQEDKQQVHTVKCDSCGAESTLRPHVSAERCPFCDTPLLIQNEHTRTLIKPRHLLPFVVNASQATSAFKTWLSGLWFAPDSIKHAADRAEPVSGVYIPFWTYDSATETRYTGQRGDNYTVRYQVQVNGQSQTRTRVEIRWTSTSGVVSRVFDDVLVLASKSLPRKQTAALEPWDLHALVDYQDAYLAGFRAETYQVDLKEGFEDAKQIMKQTIHRDICSDIGGDHQRVSSTNTRYSNVTFKHLLLPVWVSAYRHDDKVFRFVVNARTGEVQGERPYSWVKITLAVLGGMAVLGLLLALGRSM